MTNDAQPTRKVLIAGAAKGLGRAMTALCRREGAVVVAVDSDEPALRAQPPGDDLIALAAAPFLFFQGIRCNAICPGRILTGIADGIDISPGGQAVMTHDRDVPPEATPEQIAAVAVFLAGDCASYGNGAAIRSTGGGPHIDRAALQ